MQTEITIAFDAGQSVHQQGNGQWKLQPVVSIVSNTVAPTPEPEPEPEPAPDSAP